MNTFTKQLSATTILALSVTIPSLSYADQCQVITTTQADAFTHEVKVGDELGSICEPCGEKPDANGNIPLTTVESIEVKTQDGYAEVYVNHEPIDLAYTYIVTSETGESKTVSNAAKYVGCSCMDVSNTFTIHK